MLITSELFWALRTTVMEQTNVVGSGSWLLLMVDVKVTVYPQPDMTKGLFLVTSPLKTFSSELSSQPSTNLLWQRPFLELWALSHKLKITAEAESRRETER